MTFAWIFLTGFVVGLFCARWRAMLLLVEGYGLMLTLRAENARLRRLYEQQRQWMEGVVPVLEDAKKVLEQSQ